MQDLLFIAALCRSMLITTIVAATCFTSFGQERSVAELNSEVENYTSARSKQLMSEGKKIDSARREDIGNEKRALAKRYAAQAAARTDLKEKDLYYLGMLYLAAEDVEKTLETMQRFLAQYPPDTTGDMIQAARFYVVVFAARRKLLSEAEQTLQLWLTGSPLVTNQRPVLENALAVGFFKEGEYEKAIEYGRSAFELLKTLKAGSVAEKRSREQTYANLVEVLALSYRKSKNAGQALDVLAEARAESLALPSADLYRKVMDFVEGSGFSEKKLMQRVESYASAEPAPGLGIEEWIGQEPVELERLRGKVVLLDFWATWCGPCIATFPRLRSWHKKFSAEDIVLVGVTQFYGVQEGKKMSKLQELEYLANFRKKHKLPYSFAVLGDRYEAMMKYGVNAYPTTVLLDRNGAVRYIGIGAGIEESENLENTIEKVLKESPRPTAASY